MAVSHDFKINQLIEKLGFRYVKRQVKTVLRTSSQSKVDFIQDVVSGCQNNAPLRDKLVSLGEAAIHLGTRQVELYSIIDIPVVNEISEFFANVELEAGSKIAESYPFPLESLGELKKIKLNDVFPLSSGVTILGDAEYKFVVLSTVSEKEVKTSGEQFLNREGQDLVRDNNAAFYVYRKQKQQHFHVIYWSEELGSLIISVDRKSLSVGDSQDQLFTVKHFISRNVVATGDPMDVFQAISPLYDDASGFVVKLGHVTTQSNPVRLTLRGAEKCLKQDRYHDSGESGGHVAGKFSIAKKWIFTDDTSTYDIEVELSGKPAMLDTSQRLTDFAVIKCKRIEDFHFAVQNVSPHATLA